MSAANRASWTIASGDGLGDATWPPDHSESIGQRLELAHEVAVGLARRSRPADAVRSGHRSTSASCGPLGGGQAEQVEDGVVVLAEQRAGAGDVAGDLARTATAPASPGRDR